MNIIQQIQLGIDELYMMGCKEENLIIALSPLVETSLINHAAGEMTLPVKSFEDGNVILKKIQGVAIYNKHPYNEILIYDVKRACLDERFIYKIKIGNFENSKA